MVGAEWVIEHLGLPDRSLEIDRVNNDGHYEPGNLRWATRSQQSRNTRRSNPNSFIREDYRFEEWPYEFFTVRRLRMSGLSRQEILDRAARSVGEKCKGWHKIQARLLSMTYLPQDHRPAIPHPESSSTTAGTPEG